MLRSTDDAQSCCKRQQELYQHGFTLACSVIINFAYAFCPSPLPAAAHPTPIRHRELDVDRANVQGRRVMSLVLRPTDITSFQRDRTNVLDDLLAEKTAYAAEKIRGRTVALGRVRNDQSVGGSAFYRLCPRDAEWSLWLLPRGDERTSADGQSRCLGPRERARVLHKAMGR